MQPSILNLQITFAALVALGGLFYSLVSFVLLQREKRRLETRKYADDIRRAASKPTVALERWRELALGYFEDIQTILTDADGMLVRGDGVVVTRDSLWKGLCAARSVSVRRLIDADLEGAYQDLFGYDTRIQSLYHGAVARLKAADRTMHNMVLQMTQNDVLSFASEGDGVDHPSIVLPHDQQKQNGENGSAPRLTSAELGNKLRKTCRQIEIAFAQHTSMLIEPLRQELLVLIHASDREIVDRKVTFRPEQELFDVIEGKPIGLADVLGLDLSNAPLVHLVACQTGFSHDWEQHNEAYMDRISQGLTLATPQDRHGRKGAINPCLIRRPRRR